MKTNQQETLDEIRKSIAGFSSADQAQVEECALRLKGLIKRYGDHGLVALSLFGAELAAEQERQEKIL